MKTKLIMYNEMQYFHLLLSLPEDMSGNRSSVQEQTNPDGEVNVQQTIQSPQDLAPLSKVDLTASSYGLELLTWFQPAGDIEVYRSPNNPSNGR